jgi:hypothetical protein
MTEFHRAAITIRLGEWTLLAFTLTSGTTRRSAKLAQRFAGHHGRGQRDVEAAAAALHRDHQPRVGDLVHIVGHAGRLTAEEQDIAVFEMELRVGQGRPGGQEHEPAAFGTPPLGEAREVDMPSKPRHFEIVHAGAPQIAIGDIEAGRFDNVDADAETGGHAQYGAGVAGDVGLVERDANAFGQLGASSDCGYPATVLPSTEKNRSAAVAISSECGYRAAIVNTNRRRQAWYICLSHFSPAELAGLRPDGGFGSTLFLTFQSFIVSIPAGIFSRSPKESSDVFQTAARAESPA